MLRLLQNKLSSRSLFFREIVAFVTFLHILLIALFCLLGFQQYKNERFTIRSQSQLSSIIVFLPLTKHVDPAINAGKKKGELQKHQSRKIIDYQSYLEKQGYNVVSESRSKKKPVKKTALKKASSSAKAPADKKKKTIAKKKVVAKKKAAPKKKAPADKKVVAKKKSVTSKPVQKKKPIAKKVVEKPVKKTSVKKKSVEAKKVAAKKASSSASSSAKASADKKALADKDSSVDKKVEAAALPQEDLVESKTVEAVDLSDVTFVGYRELDTLQLQSKIQLAVEQYWSPPVGMPQKTVCELQVTIEKAGKVVGAKVIKSSKIMAFDLAARSAIHKTKFPQDVWGKQITVELGI